jgi:flagellar basal body-associated protein FliL
MKSKLKIILPLALIVFGGVYKFALAKPAPAPKHKIAGEVYVLPKSFLLNLSDGKYVSMGVALVLKEGYSAVPAAGGHAAAATPPDGYGSLPQEPVIRSIVTDTVTDASSGQLVSRKGRDALRTRILRRIDKHTDVQASDVLLTDVAVQ